MNSYIEQRSSSLSRWKSFAIYSSLFLLALLPRLAMASVSYGGAIIDIERFEAVAEKVLQGGIAYDLPPKYYPYPPLWMYIEAAALQVSDAFNISFDFVIKIPSILADGALSIMIYTALLKRGNSKGSSLGWSLLFVFNPVSIMISGGHGQFDSLPIAFSLLSILLLVNHKHRPAVFILSGLSMGMGILLKLYPLIFVPPVLLYLYKKEQSTGKLWSFMLLSLLPIMISLAPYVARLDWVAITRPLRYPALGGVTDFGLLRVLGILGVPIRDISSAPNMKDLWLIDELITFIFTQGKLLLLSKLVFFLGYVAYVSKMRMRVFSLIGLCFSIIILLYTAVGGLSAQYLIWVLPFAIIERDRMSIWYSLIAGISLFGFYFTLYPEALIGLNAVPESIASAASTLWPRVTVILWATCAIWLYLRLKSGGAPNQESISLETPR